MFSVKVAIKNGFIDDELCSSSDAGACKMSLGSESTAESGEESSTVSTTGSPMAKRRWSDYESDSEDESEAESSTASTTASSAPTTRCPTKPMAVSGQIPPWRTARAEKTVQAESRTTQVARTAQVERSAGVQQTYPKADNAGSWTTVMLKNVPNDYTVEMLVDFMNYHGFEGAYDFVYLPIDWTSHCGLGYAFINLVSGADASRFWKTFNGMKQWSVPSKKVAEVCWGKDAHQGLASNIERYRNSPVMHADVSNACKPQLFSDGKRIPFPAPTRRMRDPRARETTQQRGTRYNTVASR